MEEYQEIQLTIQAKKIGRWNMLASGQINDSRGSIELQM